MIGHVEIRLIEQWVRVERSNPATAELQQVVADRLRQRAAIGDALDLIASGRIQAAVDLLKPMGPRVR